VPLFVMTGVAVLLDYTGLFSPVAVLSEAQFVSGDPTAAAVGYSIQYGCRRWRRLARRLTSASTTNPTTNPPRARLRLRRSSTTASHRV
jgi:hypothetical protein